METFANTLTTIVHQAAANVGLVLWMLAVLWGIQCLNALSKYALNYFGLIPRTVRGLIGIVLCPLLHGNFEHLFINSIVLFILLSLMLLYGTHLFIVVTLIIVLLGGALVWVFGRPAIHVGASGLVMGYWVFLLVSAYQTGTLFSIIVAALCLLYLSTLWLNLFPVDKKSSWEAHFFGGVAGAVAIFLLPYFG